MIELKVTGTRSWLDPKAGKAMSHKLGEALWKRCQGRRGLFVTLTYDRNEYANSRQLYARQSRDQHVPLFLRKVSRYLGRSLKGKWFCKLEFQKGGWVHWHIIILDVNKIPHDVATKLWGHGHVWLKRLNKSNVKYCTKYVGKDGEVPAWLYAERPRSVKIVRVSPGFWGRSEKKEVSSFGPPESDQDESECATDPYDMYGPAPAHTFPIYKPIGQSIDENRDRIVARDEHGHYVHAHADLGSLLVALLEAGCGVAGTRQGWLVIDADLKDLDRAVGACASACEARGGTARSLHLRRPRNPDAEFTLPPWLDRWFREDAIVIG